MKYHLVILLAAAATSSYAQGSPSAQLLAPQILLCKLVQDSAMRLNCYDNAIAVLSSQPSPSTSVVNERSWEITEESDEPRSIRGTLIGESKTGTLVLRCRENRTEVSVDFGTALKSHKGRVRIIYRINDAKDVEGQWNVLQDAKDASPPKPISFVRSLPNEGTLSIQAMIDQNLLSIETFKLGEMSELKAKLGSLCKWPEPSTSTQKRLIPIPRSSPIRVNQDDPQKQNMLPSWLSNILK